MDHLVEQYSKSRPSDFFQNLISMKRKFSIFFVTVILSNLSGCVSSPARLSDYYLPTAQERQQADYGTFPENYQEIVSDYMRSELKDPESARYRYVQEPRKTSIEYGKTLGDMKFGYNLLVLVNAKNSYGGYTGETCYNIDLRNGTVYKARNNSKEQANFARLVGGSPSKTACDDELDRQRRKKNDKKDT